MSHKEVLQQLCPITLGGDFDTDLTVEGAALDRLLVEADSLLAELFPDRTSRMIHRWEVRLGIPVVETDPFELRRDRVVAKWRAKGSLSVPFFQSMAEQLGYTVTIDECVDGDPNVWRLVVSGLPVYQFVAGESAAGDSLLSWDAATALEGLFDELKPALSRVIYEYS